MDPRISFDGDTETEANLLYFPEANRATPRRNNSTV